MYAVNLKKLVHAEMFRAVCRILMDFMLVLLLIPMGFTLIYFFHLFFTGDNRLDLMLALVKLALSLSWISCSFLFVIGLSLRLMIQRGVKWYVLFAVAFFSGAGWLILWNLIVEPVFTFWRSLLPLAICSAVSTAYALGRYLLKDDRLNFSRQITDISHFEEEL
jgi:hypothetical protein